MIGLSATGYTLVDPKQSCKDRHEGTQKKQQLNMHENSGDTLRLSMVDRVEADSHGCRIERQIDGLGAFFFYK